MPATHEYANGLLLFALIVDCGLFSKACVTSSVVSKRIGRLEKSLGVRLLYRTTRSLTLTESGQALYLQARDISAKVQDALYAVSEKSEEITGTIRMSVPTISGELLLSESVAEFCARHPGLKVEMRLENRFVDLVEEGVDLAIRTGTLPNSSLIARPILESVSAPIVPRSPTTIIESKK
ncbi:D-malate degradation protein R [Serratia plymuthica]|nr:D-malate degradation protein R [Serratia plymuthica]VEI20988.1 D-malate degradation protein R [Serratia plymuthica]